MNANIFLIPVIPTGLPANLRIAVAIIFPFLAFTFSTLKSRIFRRIGMRIFDPKAFQCHCFQLFLGVASHLLSLR